MTPETALPDVSSGAPPPASPPETVAPSATTTETSPVPSEQLAGSVSAGDDATAQQPVDIFEGIPSLDELQRQVEQKVPQSEGLFRLRTELERIKPEYESLQGYKPLTERGDTAYVTSRLDLMDSMFSEVRDASGQIQRDERGIAQRSSRPFFDKMEADSPGFAARHFGDLLDYEVLDPVTGQKDTLSRYFFRAINLDPDRYEDYRNLDTLLAKSNGAVSADELTAIADPDKDAYKTLPSSLRNRWLDMAEDEQRWHLDTAKDRMQTRQQLDAQKTAQQQAEQQYAQRFEAQLQQSVQSDLATVRTDALTTLRDNLTKAALFSGENAINEDYVDAILAPLALLIDPELQSLGAGMLERMGVKLDADFNETIRSFVVERENFKRAEAYQDTVSANEALRRSNGLQAKLMAKFNAIALKRAERFGYQAKRIATQNGNTLTAAAAVRAQAPGNGQPETRAGLLPAGMDPRSSEAAMYQWHQSQGLA